jgi:molybdate transport system substrate-binding protein
LIWSADPTQDLSEPAVALSSAHHIAIANPKLAPYGNAAAQAIEHLGFSRYTTGKIVMGENIGQAFALVQTGAADLGFVTASVLGETPPPVGSYWRVPVTAHEPIRQDAALLAHGQNNAAARGFLAYLQSAPARAIIGQAGYGAGQ